MPTQSHGPERAADRAPSDRGADRNDPRVLLIRPRKIGDVVLCTPLFRALRKAHPASRIVFLTAWPCGELLEEAPNVDRVLDYPTGGKVRGYIALARALRQERFDAVVDLFSSPATARLAWFTGAPRRIGFRIRGRTWAYTDPIVRPRNPEFSVLTLARLLEPLGVPLAGLRLELRVPAQRRERARILLSRLGIAPGELFVAVVPAAHEEPKLWQAERYAAVADWIAGELGLKVLLISGPGREREVATAVWRGMKQQVPPPLEPFGHLGDLAAVLEQCALYVGADVGTRHIAIGLGVPTVGIFGRGFPETWTPPDDPLHIAVAHDPGCKSACTFPRCETLACIRDIPESAVREAVTSLLPAVRGRGAGGQGRRGESGG